MKPRSGEGAHSQTSNSSRYIVSASCTKCHWRMANDSGLPFTVMLIIPLCRGQGRSGLPGWKARMFSYHRQAWSCLSSACERGGLSQVGRFPACSRASRSLPFAYNSYCYRKHYRQADFLHPCANARTYVRAHSLPIAQ